MKAQWGRAAPALHTRRFCAAQACGVKRAYDVTVPRESFESLGTSIDIYRVRIRVRVTYICLWEPPALLSLSRYFDILRSAAETNALKF